MSEAEANARRASRWTWACIGLMAIGALGSVSPFMLVHVAVLFGIPACGCAIWCASAKGYPWYLGLLGPFVALALPSLHPILEKIERSREVHGRARPLREPTGPIQIRARRPAGASASGRASARRCRRPARPGP